MLGTFSNAWKVKELRNKLLYILLVLLIFRVGSVIPLPGINMDTLREQLLGGPDGGFLAMLVGGEWGTIFAMGIAPYITASIIMQLLTVAVPALAQLKKEGAEGRKKINQITRYLAVAMAILQAAGMVFSWRAAFHLGADNFFFYAAAAVAMVAGTMFIMWLSELLTEKGLGNGASFIIFANILSALPMGLATLWNHAMSPGVINVILVLIILVIFVFVVGFTVMIAEGQRKLPVQYSKKMVGRQLYGGQSSFIPVKVNLAGVLPMIFAMSILGLPQQLMMFFPENTTLANVASTIDMAGPIGAPIYVVLIFAFTFFYASFSINPTEMAENLRKNGGFIPGIRPGKPTIEFIQRTITRMSWIGATAYSAIAMLPIVIQWITMIWVPGGIPIGFGGTTIIIVVGVALEIVKKLEAQLLMRNYKGFLAS
ncbi:MAG: preprotein translocase subunit SecY [Clostridiales bacterium]|jgi:preprotein translocase subunit SecY|nr:preprotein translocase subunit SecY [Clostridiales bacterium]